MEGALLLCLLCLQGSLLVSTLNCADKGISKQTDEYRRECVTAVAAEALPAELRVLKPLAPSGALQEPGLAQLSQRVKREDDRPSRKRKPVRPGAYSINSIIWIPEGTKKPPASREKRQLDSEWHRHRKLHLPGTVSVTGRPMRPMQTERARRHLPANKKKTKRKSRIGSFSLLSNIPIKPLQAIRVKRQLQNERKKKKTGRTGTYSALGMPGSPLQGQRTKRNVKSKKQKTKKAVCS